MNRRRALVVLLLIAAACGAPAEVASTTTATVEEPSSTTQAPPATSAPETTTTTPEVTTSVVDDHGDGEEHSGAGEHGDDGTTGDERVVEIVMTEFAFDPESVDVKPGETVRFVVTNEGAIEHELRLSNQHRVDEHIASGHEDHGDEGHHDEDGDKLVLVAAGETAELVIEIPENTTIYTLMACLIPGHYEAGMVGSLEYG